MKIVSIIAAILLLTGCPNPADIDPGPSLPTGLDSPDTSGNLYVVNQIADTPVLLYTEDGGTLELKKRIPSTGEAFLVDIPNPSGFAKTLKLWKQGDDGPLENPSEESLYRRWDVVLSTDSDPSNRATWIITDRTSGGSASGTLLFSYPDTGADGLKNIYSADVFLNNKDGAKITALSPGTDNKKVGVEYGYYPVYYRYWYDDPNDSAGAEEVGWVTTDDEGNAIDVILNAGSDTTSFDVPVYYASVGKSGTVYIVNELNQAAQIYADSGLIEDIHQITGSTSSLSILTDRGGSYTFRIPVGRYNLEAKSLKSGDVLASFSGLDISEKHGAVWVINSSSTGWDIEITNELTMAMSLHDAASGDYLGFTLDPAETRTVRIPGSMTTIKALNRFNDMEAEFDGPGSSWTISADNVSRKVEMTVLAPASGSSTSESKPSFRWAAVPWAAKYEVQIADSLIQLAAAPVQETAASNYTPSTALADGQIHYWRVRAVDESGLAGQWSETYSLTVSWGTISGQSPANGASTADTTPALSWSAVSGAAHYEVRIAGGENGLSGAAEQQTSSPSYTPSEALTNGQTHYWQVRAVDESGLAGQWSETYSLTVNWGNISGQSPANGASTADTTPALNWSAVSGAAHYEVRIAGGENGLSGAAEQQTASPSYTPSEALANGQTHYWQVRAVDGDGQNGAWSTARTLTVNWGTISGQSPANGASTADITPALSWSAVSGAAHYKVRIAGGENGLAGAAEHQTASTSYSPSEALTNGQTHYWQVRAVDGGGQSGAWSGIYALTVNWGGISGMTPANGTAVGVYSPVLQWNPVGDAARYELQFADSQEKLPTVSAQETRDASWTAASLVNNQTYYWRVRALEAGGQTGPWSAAVSFTVQWGTITRMAPADGTETKDSPPTFSWGDVDAAVRYELQIADSKADLASTAPIEVSTPAHTPVTLAENQFHYWRVRAKGSGGQDGPWSPAASLLVDKQGGDADGAVLLNLPSVSISGVIGPAGDHDWFKIDLPGDGLFTVETTGSVDTEAALLDANLSRIAADDDSGADGNFKIERYMQPGIYYIEVNELGDNGTGDYTLQAEFAQDIGDDRQSAEPLVTSGADIPTALEIADDADWYKLSLDQPRVLTVDTSGGLDTYGRLYNADGSVLIKEDDNSGSGDNFRIERSLASGTYYVEVRENGDDAAGDYTLTASWSAASAVKSFNGHYYEFVGETVSWTEARTRAESTWYDGQFGYLATIVSREENDFLAGSVGGNNYWIGASDAGNEGVWIWETGPEAGIRLDELYENWYSGEPNDGGGREDYAHFRKSSSTWNDAPSSSSMYYIIEYGQGKTYLNLFTLKYGSDTLSVYQSTGSQGSLVPTWQDADDNVLTLEGETEVVYAIDSRPAGAAESHVTLAADGTLSVSTDAVFADSGEYRIGTSGKGDYAGSKTAVINIDIEDHGDDVQNATPVNSTSSTGGRIESAGDADWFKIEIAALGELSMKTTGTLDTYGVLLDANGEVLLSDRGSGSEGNFKMMRSLETGTYYIKVGEDGDNAIGSYALVLDALEWRGTMTGLSPTDGSSTPDTTPTFSWDAVPGAAGYELQLAESRAGVETAQIQSITGTSYTPSSALTNKQTYYWRVRAKDGAGQYGSWSATASLEVINVPTEGLLAYYPFDGNADDASGNGHDGNVYGPSLSADRLGNQNSAYEFDGNNDYIDIGDKILFGDGFAFSIWFKSYHTDSSYHGLIGDPSRNNSNRRSPGIWIVQKTQIHAGFSDGTWKNFTTSNIFNANEWTHLVVQYDADTSYDVYINGFLEYTSKQFASRSIYQTPVKYIGMSEYDFSGKMDDIRIYSRALTPDEIELLYKE